MSANVHSAKEVTATARILIATVVMLNSLSSNDVVGRPITGLELARHGRREQGRHRRAPRHHEPANQALATRAATIKDSAQSLPKTSRIFPSHRATLHHSDAGVGYLAGWLRGSRTIA